MQDLGHLKIGENPEEMLGCDLQLTSSTSLLREAVEFCEKPETTCPAIFGRILEDEEEHVDWLETHELIQSRLQNYLQSQM